MRLHCFDIALANKRRHGYRVSQSDFLNDILYKIILPFDVGYFCSAYPSAWNPEKCWLVMLNALPGYAMVSWSLRGCHRSQIK